MKIEKYQNYFIFLLIVTLYCNLSANEIEDWSKPLFSETGFEAEDTFSIEEHRNEQKKVEAPPETYLLRVGDTLALAVYGEQDTYQNVTIDPSGKLSYLFIHDFKAVDLTVREVREQLQKKLENYFKYPLLLLTPQNYVPQLYTVFGEVNLPGVKQLQGNTTLIKAFAESGGFATRVYRDQTMYLVDFDRCFLARNGECYLNIDFEALLNGDFSQNVKLENDDFIYIAGNSSQKVFILGEVRAPGSYEFFGEMSLIEAIAYAGGLDADASSRVSVVRGAISHPTQYLIDINLMRRGKVCDFPLRPSDIIYVPPRKFTNLRLFTQAAIRGFVGNIASQAGNNAFIQTTPAAAGETATGSTLDFSPASSPTVIAPP